MKDLSTVIWDVETAGLEPKHATIQIAAIAVRGWQEVDSFERKIRFDVERADPEALTLNGYSAEVWAREAIDPSQAIEDLDRWLRGYRDLEKVSKRTGKAYKVARVAGWNVRFDCERIERGFKSLGKFLPAASFEALDLMQIARGHFWDATERPENMKLSTVAAYLGFDTTDAHDALADVRLSMRVARAIT